VKSEIIPLASYIFITTFTPGPNNVSSTAAGAALGFRKSLPYLLGITAGFMIVMLASGYLNLFLQAKYSLFAGAIKWIGFFYMIWLCVSLFIHKKNGESRSGKFSVLNGMLLQLVNPKVILYGITLYGMFSTSLLHNRFGIPLSSLGLSLVGFVSVLTWCLAGTAFNRFLNYKTSRFVFNCVLAALLLATALEIVLF
jgi:cysteine/O-acetylserine efflux protein